MNGNEVEPISAFAIYSQKSKQKKRRPDVKGKKELHEWKKIKHSSADSKHNEVWPSGINQTKPFNLTKRIEKLNKKSKKLKRIGLRNIATTAEHSPSHQFQGKTTFTVRSNEYDDESNTNISNNKVMGENSNIKKYKVNEVYRQNKKNIENNLTHLTKIQNNISYDSTTSEETNDNIEESNKSEEEFVDSSTARNDYNTLHNESKDDHEDNVQNSAEPYNLKREISELSENINGSSVDVATGLFKWMIMPVSVQKFMRTYWEKTPLFVKRTVRKYYSELLSTPEIDLVLRSNNILFGKHIDVTSYADGVRETHNQTGRAQPHVVWDYYANGCSVRFLNPQAFVKKIFALNTTLQDYFGCFVGSNVYLTPPDSQGFAPHYDDIEAFVLQIEGKKRWKVYRPRNKHEYLDRVSSPNFSQEEIGTPMLDIVLEAGDMLYFPRGFIHQGCTVPGEHSLHITLSAYQRTAWIDLLEKVIPMALQRAAYEDVVYRKGLPIGYLQSLGLGIHSSSNKQVKKKFIEKAKDLVAKLADHLDDIETAVDQMGVQFMHDALPPLLTSEETAQSVFGDGLRMEENGSLSEHKALALTSKVKLLRANICRVAEEEGETRLYYTVDNSLEYHAEEPQYLLLSPQTVLLVQHLIHKYPEFVAIDEIPYPNEDERYQAVSDLWERGLLLTDRPLEKVEEKERVQTEIKRTKI